MEFGNRMAGLMRMSDGVWLRHANPLSGWTRAATMPVLFAAIWSYVWIGWAVLVPVGVVAVWLWLNPRVFPRPKHADAWMTKGVLGERVWLNRKDVPIPVGFERAAAITSVVSGVMLLLAIYGLVIRDFWLALLAWHFSAFAKLWFLDRMVWLWEVMKDSEPSYRAWEASLSAA